MYFDNAATSFPKPESVYQAVDHYLRHSAANPGRSGHRMAVEAETTIARARLALARLVGVSDPARLVWTSNCTAGLNLALKGWLRPGDHVVTTSLEHNSVARPLRSLERFGVEVTRVPCPEGRFDLRAFLGAIRPDTRMVAMLHASNVTGEVLPVAEVGAFCRSRGIRLLVDAAQTAGAYPLDVSEPGADLVAMPGHKSLYGPQGTGALYVAEGVELAWGPEGGTGSQSEMDEQPQRLPDRFESGTVNGPGIAGLGASLNWIAETGIATIRKREEALTSMLWEGLAAVPGVTLYGPPPGGDRVAVISLNVEAWEPTDAAAVLDQQFDIQCRPGLHCAPWAHRSLGTFPAGTIRFSPGYYNTDAEVERVIEAVARLAGHL